MSLLTIDIGGTSIKYARFADGKLGEEGAFGTPDNLDQFYQSLTAVVEQFKENSDVCGVAISSPGAVNKATGVIEGCKCFAGLWIFSLSGDGGPHEGEGHRKDHRDKGQERDGLLQQGYSCQNRFGEGQQK